MEKDGNSYRKRQKFICWTCVATLCILAIYTHCVSSELEEFYLDENQSANSPITSLLPNAQTETFENDDETPQGTEYALLLGLDRSRGKVGRSDTIMIVAINHDEQKIGVISVPRDLWVDIPHVGPGRINKVYRVGEKFFGEGAGMDLLTRVIEDVFDIHVSYTAAADFAGFNWVVDALGGIPVNVACPIEDCFWLNGNENKCKRLSLAAGRQRMNGETALLFARSRHGRSDLDRARRQQATLLGLWERLTDFGTILMLPELWWEMRNHITTTIELGDIPQIIELAKNIRVDSLHGLVLKPPAVTPAHLPDGKFILIPDKKRISKKLESLFTSPLPGTSAKPKCFTKNAALNWRKNHITQNAADAGVEEDGGTIGL